MKAYLIVDVDDLLFRLEERNLALDLHEIAMALRNGATLASGLTSADELIAVAVADWNRRRALPGRSTPNVQQVFVTAGYDIFNVPERAFVADALVVEYFSNDPEATVDELILVTTRLDFATLISRVNVHPHTRIRIWGDTPPEIEGMIFQPLETILGIPTKTVSMYIDFENITIGLNEQGYIIDIDRLIEAMLRQARAHGRVTHMAAYAPWGQRGSLPPIVDSQGREVSDDVPSRLALANIDPVFNLPGKNSADMRIAKDVLAESAAPNSAEVFVVASGDRDFNDVFGALRARGKQVVVWGIHGSTSRLLENNPAVLLEYLDDFSRFQRHTELGQIYEDSSTDRSGAPLVFHPSQWSSVVLQCDLLAAEHPRSPLNLDDLTDRLVEVHTVTSTARGEELLKQAEGLGLIRITSDGIVTLNERHAITQQTRLIRDRIVHRVANTLNVRSWDYVNYGFLLKGISMDADLAGPGLNLDDNWRSGWIDALVREGILVRELVAHRHNPEDLVPVIQLPEHLVVQQAEPVEIAPPASDQQLEAMIRRVIVSVEQFTSFRKFEWCPLGSLHKRLRNYDTGTAFQQAVEVLIKLDAVIIKEYDNPQSTYRTKGISLNMDAPVVGQILAERDAFVHVLLDLYQQHIPITPGAIQAETNLDDDTLNVWISIMQIENILNAVPGHQDLFSLFRTHHTVNLIAEKYGIE
jgi:hypothetical protein